MKRIMGMCLVLACGGVMAMAAPKALSLTQLDTVAAGEATAENETINTIVVDGGDESTHEVVGALATTGGIATYGDGNFTLDQDGNIAALIGAAGTGNNVTVIDQSSYALGMDGPVVTTVPVNGIGNFASLSAGDDLTLYVTCNCVETGCRDAIDSGSAAIAGYNNQVTLDTKIDYVEGDIDGGSSGVIALATDVGCSFNWDEVTTCVDVDICKSFNTEDNTLCVRGQNGAELILGANGLLGQQLATNLNVTSADGAGPATPLESTGSALCAQATTCGAQVVFNTATTGFSIP